jgi:hypothetical protein
MVHVELLSIHGKANRGRDPTLAGGCLVVTWPSKTCGACFPHVFEHWASFLALPDRAMHVPGSGLRSDYCCHIRCMGRKVHCSSSWGAPPTYTINLGRTHEDVGHSMSETVDCSK